MDSELLFKLNELRELIENTNEYKELLLAEEKMSTNEEVMLLAYKKDMALVEYEDSLKHYSKNSKEVLFLSENLAKAVYNLNNHEDVLNYKNKLDQLNLLYSEIEEVILKGIKLC